MFFKNVVTLLSGTFIAQIIPLAVAPLLSRMYLPSEFGQYGLFIALSAIGSILFSLRLDFAVSQASTDREAVNLLTATLFLSAATAFIVSTALFVAILLGAHQVFFGESYSFFLMIMLFALLQANMQSMVYFLNRSGRFSVTAKLKVMQGVFGAMGMLLYSFLDLNGLILGHFGGAFAAYLVVFTLEVKNHFKCLSWREVLSIGYENRVYPTFSLPGTLANSVYLQAPLLFIEAMYEVIFVGFYTLINRYITGPLSLLSVASSQVLLKELVGASPSKAKALVWRLVFVNSAMAIVYYAGCYLIGEDGIVLVFGEQWRGAYSVMLVLNISVCVRFVVSPLSVVLVNKSNVKLAAIWQFGSIIVLMVFLYLFAGVGFVAFLERYVLIDMVLYLIYFLFILRGLERY